MAYRFDAEVWRYPGESPWHFVTLPRDVSDEIRAETDGRRRGFGSVRVDVVIGTSAWTTSVFPESSSGCFVLPVKKAVRRKEDLEDGSPVEVQLALEGEA
jgi:hypothetical protein